MRRYDDILNADKHLMAAYDLLRDAGEDDLAAEVMAISRKCDQALNVSIPAGVGKHDPSAF